jgi:sulfate adenylyltransferase subunit 1 (EFTu-like GTPase family)
VRLRAAKPLVFDAYRRNRNTGALILVNDNTHDTVAAGMLHELPPREPNVEFQI